MLLSYKYYIKCHVLTLMAKLLNFECNQNIGFNIVLRIPMPRYYHLVTPKEMNLK